MSRTYKLFYTQGDRKNATVEGVCRRADGKTYSLMLDGTIVAGSLTESQKTQIWNYRLTSSGEMPGYTDAKKRAYSLIYVPDQQEIALMTQTEEAQHAAKMKNLIRYLENHPEVAVYKYDKSGGREQKNKNFDHKSYKGIHYVLIDETAIEEEEFSMNRRKRKAMSLLDDVWDTCEKTNSYQSLIDICYGLNTSAKPYLKQPIENYNKIEDFINKAPDRFISFMEKEAESSLVVLFRKATMGIAADKEAPISIQNGGYYFNNSLIGATEEDGIYYLRTNPKVRKYLENALDIRKPQEEIDRNEKLLEDAIEEKRDKKDKMDVTSEIIQHAEKWIEKIKKAQHVPDRMNKRFSEIKNEVEGYEDEQNRIAFKDYFNASARRNELPEEIKL